MKVGNSPLAQVFDNLSILFLHLHRLSEEIVGTESVINDFIPSVAAVVALSFAVKSEEGPRAIKADVCSELLSVLERGDRGPMHPNNVSHFLANGQIVELVSEKDNRNEVGDAFIIHARRHISHLEGRQVLLRLERLVWESGVEYNRVEVHVLAYLAFG